MISIIVSVGLDHIDILGKDIKDIARHKAGIIKNNSDVIYLDQHIEEVTNIIKDKTIETNSKLHLVEEDECKNYRFDSQMQYFDYKDLKDIPVNLKGKKQICNATICLKVVEILREKGYKIEDINIKRALSSVVHRARFEKLSSNPEIIYDGAHNPPAIDNLIETIDQYYKNKSKVFVVSILGTKDYKTIIEKLVNKYNDSVFYFTDGVKEKKFIENKELEKVAKEVKRDCKSKICTLKEGIEEIREKYKNIEEVVFIIGSFYIYKEVVSLFGRDVD